MTYVYRDPARWLPGHALEEPPVESKPKPTPKPRPLPEPIWGGALGLALAAAEVDAWERLHPVKQHREEGTHS